jgi:hypothetical protein
MPEDSADKELSPEEIERRAGEIARRLMNTPPNPRPAGRPKEQITPVLQDPGEEGITPG